MVNKIIKVAKILLLTGLFSFLGAVLVSAQIIQTDPVIEDSNIRALSLTGSIGISANAYKAWGIENRRNPLSAKASANVNFNLFGLSSGFNLLYSTTQSEFRQRMNNFSFDVTWRWLTVQAGDVGPSFSEYGLNGITIRGGYIKIAPGSFMLEVTAGQSKRKVAPASKNEFREAAFQRMSYGGKIGFGSEDGSHFFLSTHYSVDDQSSLPDAVEIAPKENLTVTPNFQVSFFDQKLSVGAEVTASAFTRDLTSPVLPDNAGIPDFVRNIFNPHESSRINYAANLNLGLSLNSFGMHAGYTRIQPGFQSLGTGQVRNDREVITIGVSKQLMENKLSIQANTSFSRNNLFDNRLQTQKNTQIGTSVTYRVTPMISVTGNYNLLINSFTSDGQQSSSTTTPQGAAPERETVSHTFTLQPTVTIQSGGLVHTFSITGSYFTLSNTIGELPNMPVIPDTKSNTFTSTLAYNVRLPGGIGINAMANYLKSKTDVSNSRSMGINIGANYTLLQSKLTLSLNGGVNQVQTDVSAGSSGTMTTKSRQLMLNLTANYRLTTKDSFSFSVRGMNNSVLATGGTTFSEVNATLNYKHSF